MPRGILATVTAVPTGAGRPAGGARRRRTRTSRSCTCCPRGAGRTPPPPPAPTPATCRPTVDVDSGRVIVVSAIDNLGKGAAGQAVQCANLMLGLPETTGLSAFGVEAMTVTAPRGFRAAGVAAGLKTSGTRTSRSSSTTAPTPPPPASSPPTGSRPPRCCGPSRSSAAACVRAVVLNSGGANACTGSPGFRDTHATAEHTAAALTSRQRPAAARRRRGRGLLHRPDRRAAADGQAAARGPRGGPGAGPRRRRAPAAEAIMTTDTRPKTTVATGSGWSVGGMAKGAGMLAPALATMLCVLTTDAVAGTGGARRGAARGHPGHLRPDRLRRLHVHQRHGAAAGQRRLRDRADARPS